MRTAACALASAAALALLCAAVGGAWCSPGCPASLRGDSVCDRPCNNSDCLWDNGDCSFCAPGCQNTQVGDGHCDPACAASKQCNHDRHDCEFCSAGCSASMKGNGFCDLPCNTPLCGYDNGDCAAAGNALCAPLCPVRWLSDGVCDAQCNVGPCASDGGDCSPSTPVCSPGCLSRSWLGDGQCDPECDAAPCERDRGDCGQCAVGCPAARRADGKCDAECNVSACGFDGGDCDAPKCEAPRSLLHNGNCDPSFNTSECLWDFGACLCSGDGGGGGLQCSAGCSKDMVGNGVCDPACSVAQCDDDGGDCAECAPGCIGSAMVGDGVCQLECNNTRCDFDGGDCAECSPTCLFAYIGDGVCDSPVCSGSCNDSADCTFDICEFNCPREWVGDGQCDPDALCSYDAGDCLKKPVEIESAVLSPLGDTLLVRMRRPTALDHVAVSPSRFSCDLAFDQYVIRSGLLGAGAKCSLLDDTGVRVVLGRGAKARAGEPVKLLSRAFESRESGEVMLEAASTATMAQSSAVPDAELPSIVGPPAIPSGCSGCAVWHFVGPTFASVKWRSPGANVSFRASGSLAALSYSGPSPADVVVQASSARHGSAVSVRRKTVSVGSAQSLFTAWIEAPATVIYAAGQDVELSAAVLSGNGERLEDRLSFQWFQTSGDPLALVSSSSFLYLPASQFTPGRSYGLGVRVTCWKSGSLYMPALAYVTVVVLLPRPVLYFPAGTAFAAMANSPIAVDVQHKEEPLLQAPAIRWNCSTLAGAACRTRGNKSLWVEAFAGTGVLLPPRLLPPGKYRFTATASWRSAASGCVVREASQSVRVDVLGQWLLRNLSIEVVSPATPWLAEYPAGREIVLFGRCPECGARDEFVWSHPQLEVMSSLGVSQTVVLQPRHVVPGGTYNVRLSVGHSHVERSFRVATAPRGGDCRVEPARGAALSTEFNVSCWGWVSDSPGLRYRFAFCPGGSWRCVDLYSVSRSVGFVEGLVLPRGRHTIAVNVVAADGSRTTWRSDEPVVVESARPPAIDISRAVELCQRAYKLSNWPLALSHLTAIAHSEAIPGEDALAVLKLFLSVMPGAEQIGPFVSVQSALSLSKILLQVPDSVAVSDIINSLVAVFVNVTVRQTTTSKVLSREEILSSVNSSLEIASFVVMRGYEDNKGNGFEALLLDLSHKLWRALAYGETKTAGARCSQIRVSSVPCVVVGGMRESEDYAIEVNDFRASGVGNPCTGRSDALVKVVATTYVSCSNVAFPGKKDAVLLSDVYTYTYLNTSAAGWTMRRVAPTVNFTIYSTNLEGKPRIKVVPAWFNTSSERWVSIRNYSRGQNFITFSYNRYGSRLMGKSQ
eukprot:m51a1_g459 hypothetical protein (1340) ;mRNA; f:160452-165395